MSRTELHKWMELKVLNHLNLIGAMKSFTKSNRNLHMEEHLTVLKNLRDKCVILMNKN